jgi:hypothetical protein
MTRSPSLLAAAAPLLKVSGPGRLRASSGQPGPLTCTVPLDRLTWPSVVTSARSSFLKCASPRRCGFDHRDCRPVGLRYYREPGRVARMWHPRLQRMA